MTPEQCARLVEEMIDQRPWREKPWSRCALAVAARAIRRGRHLTEAEKIENLALSMEDGTPEGVSASGKLRALISTQRGSTND